MYEKLIAELREYWNDGTEDLRNQAADAIEELQASVRGYEMNTDMAFVKEDGRTVIRFIPKVQCPYYRPNHHDRGDDSYCDAANCEVKAVQPVRRGRWERPNGRPRSYMYKCSECREISFYLKHEDCKYRYCPWCGAQMGVTE